MNDDDTPAEIAPLRPKDDANYWRHTCPRCDALHPIDTGTTASDGCTHYRCWKCGHVWGIS